MKQSQNEKNRKAMEKRRENLLKKYHIYDDRGKIRIGQFSDFLIEAFHLCKVYGKIYMYDDQEGPTEGLYIEAGELEEQMLKYIPDSIESTRKEVLKQISLKERKMPVLTSLTKYSNLFVFNNGVYNIKTDTLEPFNPDYIIMNKIPHDYNPDAYSETVDDFLRKICSYDEDIMKLTIQMIGYAMKRDLKEQVAFILFGPGGNGKSVFQGCLTALLGDENVSGVDIKDLSGDKFAAADLMGKLANISDDISGEYINDPATFKTITTGERLRAQKKFQDAFAFNSYATMIFSANKLPRIKDADGGVRRRLLIVPFVNKFKGKDDYDPYIKDKLYENPEDYDIETNMSYLINLGIAGLKQIKEQGGFTIPEQSETALEDYDKDCNPILQWAEEYLEENAQIHPFNMTPREDAYEDYKRWAEESNNKPLAKKSFSDFICERYELKVVPKYIAERAKTIRTFVYEE